MKNLSTADKTAELDAIIRPLAAANYAVDYSWKGAGFEPTTFGL